MVDPLVAGLAPALHRPVDDGGELGTGDVLALKEVLRHAIGEENAAFEIPFENTVDDGFSAGVVADGGEICLMKWSRRDGDAGLAARLEIETKGQGRLYYSARIAYDLKQDNASRINSGIEVRREYSVERAGEFVLLQSPFTVRRGEIVKVDLFVSVPAARHFVVVNDPVPGGLEPVNTALATASQIDADKASFKAAEGSWFYQFSDWTYYGRYFWSFYHQELRHDSARFYADYLPAGNYRLSYAAQVIAQGDFSIMPVHVEEMYDPDVYGKGLPARLQVGE